MEEKYMIVVDLILNGAPSLFEALKDIEGEFPLEEYTGSHYKEVVFFLVDRQKYTSAMRVCVNNNDISLLGYVKHEGTDHWQMFRCRG
jgi:hypothetical protein